MSDEGREVERSTEFTFGLQANLWWPLSLSLKRTVTTRHTERAQEFGEDLRESSGMTNEEIGARIETNEQVGDVVFTSMEQATRTRDRQYRGALARVVGAGLTDDAKLDEVEYIVAILGQLEPIHLRVLVGFEELLAIQNEAAVLVETAARHLNMPDYLVASVAQRLQAVSLLTDTPGGEQYLWNLGSDNRPANNTNFGGYGSTPFAARFLQFCRGMPTDDS